MTRSTRIKQAQEKKFQARYADSPLTEDQHLQISEYYTGHYGQDVNHIWHQYYTADSSRFCVDYFPETLFIPKFEHFLNEPRMYADTFEDKNMLNVLADGKGIKTPETIVKNSYGIWQDGVGNFLTTQGVISLLGELDSFFIKPSMDSYGGKGCQLVVMGEHDKDKQSFLESLLRGYKSNFIIQEKVVNAPEIRCIHPSSLNTFRVITYLWEDGLHYMNPILRSGVGDSVVDNATSGGFSIGVNLDGSLAEYGISGSTGKIFSHPDTNLVFKGHCIPGFHKVIDAALELHKAIPQLGVINWDFALDSDYEPVVIEMNILGGSIDLAQKCHGKSAFGDLTPDILKWISRMEKLSYYDRLQLGNKGLGQR